MLQWSTIRGKAKKPKLSHDNRQTANPTEDSNHNISLKEKLQNFTNKYEKVAGGSSPNSNVVLDTPALQPSLWLEGKLNGLDS